MIKKLKGVLASVGLGFLALPDVVFGASLSSSTTDAIDQVISDMVQDTLDLFTGNVGTIFTIAAAILGVMVLYRFVRRVAR